MQNELKTKDKIIDQLLKSLTSLTNSELESKNNIIRKLLDQTNDEEKKKSIQRQNGININTSDIADNKSDEKRKAPRKLTNTLKETKQTIHRITLNPECETENKQEKKDTC